MSNVTQEIRFWVAGNPKPGGSKRSFPHRRTGQIVVIDDCAGNPGWRSAVGWAAREVMGSREPLAGPLSVRMEFYLTHPKSRYRRGVWSIDLPPYPSGKPDVLKLARSTEDALTGIVWRDDAQIVSEVLEKRWCDEPGAKIIVQEVSGNP